MLDAAFVERALAVLARQQASSATPTAAPAGSAVLPVERSASPPIDASLDASIEALRRQAIGWLDSLLALVAAGLGPAAVSQSRTADAAVPDAVRDGTAVMAPTAEASVPGALRLASELPTALSTIAASAGQMVAATMRIANDGDVEAPVRFIASDLVGDSGARIPASAVTFAPGIATVAAHAVRAVEVVIAIPPGIPPGAYAGLLQAVGQPLARSLLAVDVRPARGSAPCAA